MLRRRSPLQLLLHLSDTSWTFGWICSWGLFYGAPTCVSAPPWKDALTCLSPSLQCQTGVPLPDSCARRGEVARREARSRGTEGGHSKQGHCPLQAWSAEEQGCLFLFLPVGSPSHLLPASPTDTLALASPPSVLISYFHLPLYSAM